MATKAAAKADEQSITRVVAQIIDTLSDAVSQLMLIVIAFQEKNAAMPAELPGAAAQVEKTAKVLVDVAKSLAQEEYEEYPEIKAEIIDAANNVNRCHQQLMSSVESLRTASDRKVGWEGLSEACKVISSKTILLLQIVYGAELKRLFAEAAKVQKALGALDAKKAKDHGQAFADAAGDAATKALQLAEYLKHRAKDEESPYSKQQLEDAAREVETKAQAMLDRANEVLEEPEDASRMRKFDDAKKELDDATKRAVEPLREALERNLRNQALFDEKLRHPPAVPPRGQAPPAPPRVSEPLRDHSAEQAERERARAHLPAHERAALNAADKMREDIDDTRDAATKGDRPNVDEYTRRVDGDNSELQRAAKDAAAHIDDPTRKKQILDALQTIDRLVPPGKVAAKAAADDPNDAAARAKMEEIYDQIDDALDKLTDAINPGESLVSQANRLGRDVDKETDAAKKGDTPQTAASAHAIGKRKGKLADQAKAQAERTDDPHRKKHLNDGVNELENALPRQIEAAATVLGDPSASNREKLDTETARVHDILDSLKNAGNPSTHERLADAAERLRAALDRAENAAKAGDKKSLEEALKDVAAATAVIDKEGKQQGAAFIDPTKRQALERALRELNDSANNALPPDSRTVANDPKNGDAVRRLDGDLERARNALRDILNLTNAQPIAEARKETGDLSRLANAQKKKEPKEIADNARATAQRQARLVPLAEAAASREDDPARRKNVISALNSVDKLLPRVLDSSNAVAQNPAAADAAVTDLKSELARLQDALNPAVPVDASTYPRYKDEPDDAAFQRRKVQDAIAALERIMPQVQGSSDKVAVAPADTKEKGKLSGLLDEVEVPVAVLANQFASGEDSIAANANQVKDDLRRAANAARKSDRKGFNDAADAVARRNARLVEQAKGYADHCDDPARKKQIASAVGAVGKAVPEAVKAEEQYLSSPNDAEALRRLQLAQQRANDALDHLARAVRQSPEERLVTNADKLAKALDAVREAARRGDRTGVEHALADVADAKRDIEKDARADAEKNPSVRKDVDSLLRAIDSEVKALNGDARTAAANPSDAARQKAVGDEAARIKSLADQLLEKVKARPVAEARKADTALVALTSLSQSPDAAATGGAARDLAEHQARFVSQARSAVDPAKKAELDAALADLDRATTHTQAAAKAAEQNPNDEKAQYVLHEAVLHQRAPLAAAVAAVKPTRDNNASAAARRLEVELARVKEHAQKGDRKKTDEHLARIPPPAADLTRLASDVASSTPSAARRENIQRALATFDRLLKEHPEVARAAADNAGDRAKQSALAALTSDIVEQIRILESEIHEEEADVGARVAALQARADADAGRLRPPAGSAAADPTKVRDGNKDLQSTVKDLIGTVRNELNKGSSDPRAAASLDRLLSDLDRKDAPRQPSKPAPSLNDALKAVDSQASAAPASSGGKLASALSAVAKDLQESISKPRQGALDPNDPLRLASNTIAELIAKLASAAARGARQEILLTGNALAKAIRDFAAQLRKIAARTKDPRLADRLIKDAMSLDTFATQLKIICSVKAGSSHDTPDTDEQLISLTRSIGSTVTEGIDTVSIIKQTGRLV